MLSKINFHFEKLKEKFSFGRFKMPFGDRGVRALVVTNFLGNVLRLFSNLILARFLSPEAFAITGLASTVVFAFNMISDGGFRAFILRHKLGDEDDFLKTLWTIKLLRNFILAMLLFGFSDVIASYFDMDSLGEVLQVLCLVFIVDAFLPVSFIAVERENKVSGIMYTRFFCTLLSTIYSIVGVYYYQTYWPIIQSVVLNYVLQVVFGYFFIGSKGSGLSMNKAVFIEFMGWAKYVIPSSIITLLLMQLDKVVLAKNMTVNELGLYFVAFNFSSAAAAFSIQYARRVFQPYMSMVYRQSPASFVDDYYSKRLNLSLALAFSFGFLSGSSFVFFDVLYDDRYSEAGYYLSILLVMPIMALITYPAEIALILHGKLKITLVVNVIRLVWFALAAWIGFLWLDVLGLLLAVGFIELLPAIYMSVRLKVMKIIDVFKESLIVFSAVIGFVISRLLIFMFSP